MTLWLAGMRITAQRLRTATVESTTTGLVAASGFTVNNFDGYKCLGTCTVRLYLLRSGTTITASSGNIADTQMCTLPQGYRPPSILSAIWGTGFADGEATVSTTGVVTLRSASGDIVGETTSPGNGHNIRMTLTFLDPR